MYICYVEESRPSLWSSGQSSFLQNGDVLCFLWGTNSIYICYVEESRPPLWPSGQSSWLQIQRSGFDSRRYWIFWEVVGLERGPLSLVSTIVQFEASEEHVTSWPPASDVILIDLLFESEDGGDVFLRNVERYDPEDRIVQNDNGWRRLNAHWHYATHFNYFVIQMRV
jgi:hypothetical protein